MSKKIVKYDSQMLVQESPFGGVFLYPIDHPDVKRVSNDRVALTSKVVSWNKETGVIETQNTIYEPYHE